VRQRDLGVLNLPRQRTCSNSRGRAHWNSGTPVFRKPVHRRAPCVWRVNWTGAASTGNLRRRRNAWLYLSGTVQEAEKTVKRVPVSFPHPQVRSTVGEKLRAPGGFIKRDVKLRRATHADRNRHDRVRLVRARLVGHGQGRDPSAAEGPDGKSRFLWSTWESTQSEEKRPKVEDNSLDGSPAKSFCAQV